MKLIKDPEGVSAIIRRLQSKGKSIGFVPTMGALHKGHLSLLRRARKDNDILAVSIFVNPEQFGPNEDLKHYPRPLRKDLLLCRKEGADLVFCPSVKEIYPAGFRSYVAVRGLGGLLCGQNRPGHFRGVATVVAKLFNIIRPDRAYFGKKDFQQAVIIKRMARDLNFPTEIKVLPTVRETDGLALSSRNIYLTRQERQDAPVLYHSLLLAKFLVDHGARDSSRIISRMRALIAKKKNIVVDYITVADAETLLPLKKINKNCLIALAARIGKTRLIDNLVIGNR